MASNKQTIEAKLLALQDRTLLVPAQAVTDVVPMAGLIVESHADNPWILGRLHWRGLRIPVISFELMTGATLQKHSEHARIAIFHRYSEDSDVRFWGMLIQDNARTVAVSEAELQGNEEAAGEIELVAATVNGNIARIPDFGQIDDRMQIAGLAA